MAKRIALLVAIFFIFTSITGCEKLGLFSPRKSKLGDKRVVRGTVLARVNDYVITLEEFNERIKNLATIYEIKTAEEKKMFLEDLIQQRLLAQEAISRGLDKKEEVSRAMEDFKVGILASELQNQETKGIEISETEVEDFYNNFKEQFKEPEQREVAEIVVEAEPEAKKILISLLENGDFASAAKQSSISNTASDGGEVGWIVRARENVNNVALSVFPKFEETAFSLDKGQISSVFKGPKGYCIIKVEDIKPSRQRDLVEVREDIKAALKEFKGQETVKSLADNLRQKSHIEIKEDLIE